MQTNTARQGTHLSPQRAVVTLAIKVLKPLVRMLMRHGLSYHEFCDIGRWVYVDVANNAEEFTLPGRKLSKSRVAVLTGLSRKEVLRLSSEPSPDESDGIASSNRAARVIGGWCEDPLFSHDKDQPKELPIKGETPSFADLVRLYSGDVPHKAVLDELLRCEAVEMTDDGRVRLKQFGYIPKTGSGKELEVVSICGNDLLRTMEHNSRPGCSLKYPQLEHYNTRIPVALLPEVREYTRNEINALGRRVHHFLHNHADDVKKSDVEYARAGIGFYYFES